MDKTGKTKNDWRQLFQRFWNKNRYTLSIANPERFYTNMMDTLGKCQDDGHIDEYVRTLRQGRESTRRIIVQFYRYLQDEEGIEVESELFNARFFDYPFERQLEIAKYLYEPRTADHIARHFNIDKRTVRADLQALEDGIEVLGTVVRIIKEKRGRTLFYKCTMHPIFLPLNLTEVYAMTVYLERMMTSRDMNSRVVEGVINRIKAQLSDYAFEKLYPGQNRPKENNGYLSDELLAKQREGILMYLMKSGVSCQFIWEGKTYQGSIVYDFEKREYRIKTEEGDLLDARPGDVEFIIDSMEYR